LIFKHRALGLSDETQAEVSTREPVNRHFTTSTVAGFRDRCSQCNSRALVGWVEISLNPEIATVVMRGHELAHGCGCVE
jgi:hypothetical protein